MAKDTKKTDYSRKTGLDVKRLRGLVARIVWLVCLLFALALALGALLIALKANPDNSLVEFIKTSADSVDLGAFDLDNGIKQFGGANGEVKNALFNWGLGAIVWLIIGRIVSGLIRP